MSLLNILLVLQGCFLFFGFKRATERNPSTEVRTILIVNTRITVLRSLVLFVLFNTMNACFSIPHQAFVVGPTSPSDLFTGIWYTIGLGFCSTVGFLLAGLPFCLMFGLLSAIVSFPFAYFKPKLAHWVAGLWMLQTTYSILYMELPGILTQ